MANLPWEQDSNYSDHRYGVEKILTFPVITLSEAIAIKHEFVLTEDIILTELGGFVTTTISSAALVTVTINASGASSVLMATLTIASAQASAISVRQTTMTNATAAVSGTILTLNIGVSAQAGVLAQPYIKYRSKFN